MTESLAQVEASLGTRLPVPTGIPGRWGWVAEARWEVRENPRFARLSLELVPKADFRPRRITVEYRLDEPEDGSYDAGRAIARLTLRGIAMSLTFDPYFGPWREVELFLAAFGV